MVLKDKTADVVDRGFLLSEFQSPDESARTKAVSSVCPCRNGWELFEQHVDVVARLTKDRCRAVRARALHVFDDAVLIQSIEDAEYRFQSVEDIIRKKRAQRFRGEEAATEVRRTGRFKRKKGRFVLR
jgi:radical SAM superfamily enzyme